MVEYSWPIEETDIKVVTNFNGLGVDLYQEMYGALSQDRENPYSRVSVANSTFSLDPSKGCPLGCAYCVVGSNQRDIELEQDQEINFDKVLPKKITRLFSGEVLAEALIRHPAFIPNSSVISVSTGSSEAFLGSNSDDTWQIMQTILSKGYTNPFWIVTKAGIPAKDRLVWKDRFKTLTDSGINVVLSLTYGNAPKEVEPYDKNRFEGWDEIKQSGIHLSHHLRPIIRGINDNKDSVKHALEQSLSFVSSVCVGGLRLDPGIMLAWKYVNNLPTEMLPSTPGVKDLPEGFDVMVEEIVEELGYEVPVLNRSSEVISQANGWRDYNLYNYRENESEGHLLEVSPEIQSKVKEDSGITVADLIRTAAERIRLDGFTFEQRGNKFYSNNPMTYQVHRALIHSIGHYQIL